MRKKDLIQLGVTGVLAVILIFALGNALKKARLRKAKKVLPKPVDSAVLSIDQGKIIGSKNLYSLLEQQAKLIELKRDPFTGAPITSGKFQKFGVNLTGILWDKNNPLAVIDGEILKKGERIGNKTIVEIKRDRVILSDDKVFVELMLEE